MRVYRENLKMQVRNAKICEIFNLNFKFLYKQTRDENQLDRNM
jgi:hypothetical protein